MLSDDELVEQILLGSENAAEEFYLVLYIPDDDTQVVTIIRAMYGGRDVDTQLKRFTKTYGWGIGRRGSECITSKKWPENTVFLM